MNVSPRPGVQDQRDLARPRPLGQLYRLVGGHDHVHHRLGVTRRHPHPQFKKVITTYNKFYAHDEKQEARIGDRVRIVETRPISKMKRWRLLEIVERAPEVTPVAA